MSKAPLSPFSALEGVHVLVVGGSSGVGLGAALVACEAGARVTIAGRSAERLAAAAATLPGEVATLTVDGGDPASVAALYEATGPVDHLIVTLAGKLGGGDFATTPMAEYRQAFDEKFWPHLALAQGALKVLAETGSITFITGASSRRASCPGGTGFVAINGALDRLVPTLARELAPRRVNSVSPGLIDTPWHEFATDADREAAFGSEAANLPVGRIGSPRDIGLAIISVVANGFVTGSCMECDGGVRV